MARIPYPDTSSAELAELAEEVRRTRGQLLNLFRALMHAPAIAEPWVALGTAVRYGSGLDDRTRELAICQVAARTGCPYEWHHHAPLAAAAGVSQDQLGTLPDPPNGTFDLADEQLLRYADLVIAGSVDDQTFDAMVTQHGERRTTEITATIAFYISVSRFLSAMGVEIEDPAVDPSSM